VEKLDTWHNNVLTKITEVVIVAERMGMSVEIAIQTKIKEIILNLV
jgi:hypothetical protein